MGIPFEWGKKRPHSDSKRFSDYAVIVALVNVSSKDRTLKRMNLVFRMLNGAGKLIAPHTGYANYCYVESLNRVYFKEDDMKNGWKITSDGGNESKRRLQIGVNMEIAKDWEDRKGMYKLLLDRIENLYYIDLNKPIG